MKKCLVFAVILGSLIIVVLGLIIINKPWQFKRGAQQEQEFLLRMKQECKGEGEKVYQQQKEDGLILLNPEYTYNNQLNTCLYAGGQISEDGSYLEYWVLDVFSNKELVHYIAFNGEPQIQICPTCLSSVEDFEIKKKELFTNWWPN